jgi:hypothetical protein
MCGIAGIIAHEAAEDVVRRMLARIAHRGPDGEGLAVRRVGKRVATFGHRRLSIVDLAGGAQPMEDAGTRDRPGARAIVTFNGEIYDHAKTREALSREGARFATQGSDTETLVSGYARWGERIVPRLSGMFAFAAMDLRSGEVLLARDRSGIKPLYWARLSERAFEGGGIAFASELDALLEVPGIERRIDDQGLASFLFSDYAHPPHTLVRGVSKLAPGELLVLRGDGSEDGPRRYVAPQVPEEGPVPDARELVVAPGDHVFEIELEDREHHHHEHDRDDEGRERIDEARPHVDRAHVPSRAAAQLPLAPRFFGEVGDGARQQPDLVADVLRHLQTARTAFFDHARKGQIHVADMQARGVVHRRPAAPARRFGHLDEGGAQFDLAFGELQQQLLLGLHLVGECPELVDELQART